MTAIATFTSANRTYVEKLRITLIVDVNATLSIGHSRKQNIDVDMWNVTVCFANTN